MEWEGLLARCPPCLYLRVLFYQIMWKNQVLGNHLVPVILNLHFCGQRIMLHKSLIPFYTFQKEVRVGFLRPFLKEVRLLWDDYHPTPLRKTIQGVQKMDQGIKKEGQFHPFHPF